MQVKLLRCSGEPQSPQVGMMLFNNIPSLITLELPDHNNLSMVSCIPVGSYICKKVRGRQTSGGMDIPVTYEVMDVPNRSGILFHVGNYPKDTHGCILVGLKLGQAVEPMIQESKTAFQLFLALTQGVNEFDLEIKNYGY